MSRLLIAVILSCSFLVLFGGGCVLSIVGTNNDAVRQEQGIVAAYKSNQNVLSNYSTKVAEAVQIPAMQRDDLKEVITAALDARYGETGSKAAFQWIQEQNPNIDSSVYKQLQQIIEAGRNDFRRNQDVLLDKKRVYETKLNQFPSGFILTFLGFP